MTGLSVGSHRGGREHPPGEPTAPDLLSDRGEEAEFPVAGLGHNAQAGGQWGHVHEDD